MIFTVNNVGGISHFVEYDQLITAPDILTEFYIRKGKGFVFEVVEWGVRDLHGNFSSTPGELKTSENYASEAAAISRFKDYQKSLKT